MRRVAAVMLVTAVTVGSAIAAPFALSRQQPRPVDFSVSVPNDPVPAVPGQPTVVTGVRISNRLASEVTFLVRQTQVVLGDEGSVQPRDGLTPFLKEFKVQERVTVAPESQADVPITVTLADDAPPDSYFIGFAVTPVRAPRPEEPAPTTPEGRVEVENRIVNYVVLEVPGSCEQAVDVFGHNIVAPRQRKEGVDRGRAPKFGPFLIDDEVWGELPVRNVGGCGVSMTAQVFVNNVFGDKNRAIPPAGLNIPAPGTFPPPEALARGTVKTMKYKWEFGGLFAIVRPKAQVTYGRSNAQQTAELEGPLLIVVPLKTLIGAAVVLAVLLALITRAVIRRRRRRGEKKKRPRKQRGEGKAADDAASAGRSDATTESGAQEVPAAEPGEGGEPPPEPPSDGPPDLPYSPR